MKITLQNNLTMNSIGYMSAPSLPADYECTQIPVAISEARKAIGIIGIFNIKIPYQGHFTFTVKAMEFGQDFCLQIVSWDNDKYPVPKEAMSAFKASLLKELHLAIQEDEGFLNTINEVKSSGTTNYLEYKRQKRLAKTSLLDTPVQEDNLAVI